MSYQKDLEEYTDEQLLHELSRRQTLRQMGWCSYCSCKIRPSVHEQKLTNEPPLGTPAPCRLHERIVGVLGTRILVERVQT